MQAVDHIKLTPEPLTTHWLLDGAPYSQAMHRKWGMPFEKAWYTGLQPDAHSRHLTYSKRPVIIDMGVKEEEEDNVQVLNTWSEYAEYGGQLGEYSMRLKDEHYMKGVEVHFPRRNTFSGPTHRGLTETALFVQQGPDPPRTRTVAKAPASIPRTVPPHGTSKVVAGAIQGVLKKASEQEDETSRVVTNLVASVIGSAIKKDRDRGETVQFTREIVDGIIDDAVDKSRKIPRQVAQEIIDEAIEGVEWPKGDPRDTDAQLRANRKVIVDYLNRPDVKREDAYVALAKAYKTSIGKIKAYATDLRKEGLIEDRRKKM